MYFHFYGLAWFAWLLPIAVFLCFHVFYYRCAFLSGFAVLPAQTHILWLKKGSQNKKAHIKEKPRLNKWLKHNVQRRYIILAFIGVEWIEKRKRDSQTHKNYYDNDLSILCGHNYSSILIISNFLNGYWTQLKKYVATILESWLLSSTPLPHNRFCNPNFALSDKWINKVQWIIWRYFCWRLY